MKYENYKKIAKNLQAIRKSLNGLDMGGAELPKTKIQMSHRLRTVRKNLDCLKNTIHNGVFQDHHPKKDPRLLDDLFYGKQSK